MITMITIIITIITITISEASPSGAAACRWLAGSSLPGWRAIGEKGGAYFQWFLGVRGFGLRGFRV